MAIMAPVDEAEQTGNFVVRIQYDGHIELNVSVVIQRCPETATVTI